jgi:Oxysterol-binding protein
MCVQIVHNAALNMYVCLRSFVLACVRVCRPVYCLFWLFLVLFAFLCDSRRGVRTQVNNIIIGSMWVDHFGVMEVKNLTTGEKAVINLVKCGWFGKGHHEVKGEVKNASGSTKYVRSTLLLRCTLPFPVVHFLL